VSRRTVIQFREAPDGVIMVKLFFFKYLKTKTSKPISKLKPQIKTNVKTKTIETASKPKVKNSFDFGAYLMIHNQ
jgi:hypothetical protein